MKQGIVIAHGPLGAAYIEAAKTIMGTDEGLFALSVTDMAVQEIASRLESIIGDPRDDVDGIVIMACLRGGSSWNVSAAVLKDRPKVRLVSGVNLAMLLTFLTKRETLPLDELVEKLKIEAINGVTVLNN